MNDQLIGKVSKAAIGQEIPKKISSSGKATTPF